MVSIDLADLAHTLRLSPHGELISLVGGGGKTTSLFALGEQLARTGSTVLTTTTKMGAEQSGGFPQILDPSDDALRTQLTSTGRALVWKSADDRRATGVGAADCDRWFATVATNVVVEADGSRKRPFKAPAAHEPVVPPSTTLLIACIGVSAIGHPIAERCHRPDLVASLASCSVDDELTAVRAAAILLSSAGSKKDKPAGARFAVALHRVTAGDQAVAAELADALDDNVELIVVREQSSPSALG